MHIKDSVIHTQVNTHMLYTVYLEYVMVASRIKKIEVCAFCLN